jgi:hypothetical protein
MTKSPIKKKPMPSDNGNGKALADDPLVGVFAPAMGMDVAGDVARKTKEHLFDGPLDERSFTPGDKDERAIYWCRFQAEANGVGVFGILADIAERVRISSDKRGAGRQDDVTVLTAEMVRLEEREKIKLIQQRMVEQERR